MKCNNKIFSLGYIFFFSLSTIAMQVPQGKTNIDLAMCFICDRMASVDERLRLVNTHGFRLALSYEGQIERLWEIQSSGNSDKAEVERLRENLKRTHGYFSTAFDTLKETLYKKAEYDYYTPSEIERIYAFEKVRSDWYAVDTTLQVLLQESGQKQSVETAFSLEDVKGYPTSLED
jgi:hypothetical protein